MHPTFLGTQGLTLLALLFLLTLLYKQWLENESMNFRKSFNLNSEKNGWWWTGGRGGVDIIISNFKGNDFPCYDNHQALLQLRGRKRTKMKQFNNSYLSKMWLEIR